MTSHSFPTRRSSDLNVIGMAGERNRPEYIAGSSANASLMAFSRALGAESVDHGVRVIGVNPGRIETERQIEIVMEAAEKKLGDRSRWKEMMAQMASTAPFKRFGRPDEVADLVVYLASARASYISATVVNIDAGQSLRP
jgi:3-oxoacyl-[acyl-carrier protein] reductase